ncbi:MAG: UbiA family prenyltransferase [Patescibacteria group bacterium]
MKFLINLFKLTRPLSNVKNIAIVVLAFYFSKKGFDLWLFSGSLISLSLVCSAFYAYNTLSDFDLDKDNKNKKHYLEAVNYFGKNKSFIIFITLLIAGLFIGYFINLYFFIFLLLLALTDFSYSFKYTRFKEKFILDILFGASFTFLFRFLAFWFVFSSAFPPLLVVAGLVFAKSGGYFLYKSLDYQYLLKENIKNSITILNQKTKIIVSILFWVIALISFIFLCFNSYFKIGLIGELPFKFLFLGLLAVPPLAVIYLSVFGKIKIKIKNLRTAGYIYWAAVLATTLTFI